MKKLSILIIISCFAIIATAQSTYEYQKRFQVQSGHVEYKLSGLTVGTKSLWWDDYGEKYREEIKSSQTVKTLFGTTVVDNHSLAISDGTYYYNVNMETMQGTKVHKNAVPDFSLLGSGLNDREMEQLSESLFKGLGGNVTKKSEKVLGRTCDVGQVMGATVHVYKGVTLRSYAKIGQQEEREEAVSFEESIRIPASKFTPPADAILEDVSAEVSGIEDFDEQMEEEQGLMYPSGISFDKFRNESDRVRRKLGYLFAMHDASGGEYSASWMKDEKNIIWIMAKSLQNYANWREDFADHGIEYFTHNGKRMAFLQDVVYDDETDTSTPVSVLLLEINTKDAFMQITAMPEKSKQQLLDIFNQFNF